MQLYQTKNIENCLGK